MDGVKVYSKIRFRELNLGGPNNVKSLNELEDRLLKTSITSLEKAKKRSLSRLNNEVKDLHHTLREQNTLRPVSSHLIKKVYGDACEPRLVDQPKSLETGKSIVDVEFPANQESSSDSCCCSGESDDDMEERGLSLDQELSKYWLNMQFAVKKVAKLRSLAGQWIYHVLNDFSLKKVPLLKKAAFLSRSVVHGPCCVRVALV